MFNATALESWITNCLGMSRAKVLLAHIANQTSLVVLFSVTKATALSFQLWRIFVFLFCADAEETETL